MNNDQVRAALAELVACSDVPGSRPSSRWMRAWKAAREALAEPTEPPGSMPSREWARDLVAECGLDWHRGFALDFEALVRAALQTADLDVATLREQNAALVQDAERYRWMCANRLGWFSRRAPVPWQKQSMKDALDGAIDAAITKAKT